MKISKKMYLALAILFLISFIYSLCDTGTKHELLFWEVNIWVYRFFRLALAVLFMKSYLDIKKVEEIAE